MIKSEDLLRLYPISMSKLKKLRRIHFGFGATALVSDQSKTPSRSHKFWAASFIFESWRRTGRIGGDQAVVVILSSSGSMAIACAIVTANVPNFTLHIVTDVLSSVELIQTLRSFPHVKVDVVDKPDATGSHIVARYGRIAEIQSQYPDALIVDQYANWLIPLAYQETLVQDILEVTHGEVGAVFCAAGTVGHGYAFLNHKATCNSKFSVFLVDSPGSKLFQKKPTDRRRFPGYGNGKTTAFSEACGAVTPVYVSDQEVVEACDFLLEHEGLCVGPSSGAVAAAFIKLAWSYPCELSHSAESVLVFPDAGHAYRETLWNNEWRIRNGLGKQYRDHEHLVEVL